MTGCLNGGSCVTNEKKQTYSCMCKTRGLETGVKLKWVSYGFQLQSSASNRSQPTF